MRAQMLSTLVAFEWGGIGDAEYELARSNRKYKEKGLGELRVLPPPFPLPAIKSSGSSLLPSP